MKKKIDESKEIRKKIEKELGDILRHIEEHSEYLKSQMTINDWANETKIKAKDLEKYPNAKAAVEIRKSPLYKAME